jgi:hypothetical protein
LAADAFTAEAKAQAEAEEKAEADLKAPPGPGRFPGPGGFPGRGGFLGPGGVPGLGGQFGDQPGVKPPAQIPIVFRKRLKYRVNAAAEGLAGTEAKPGGVASLAAGTPHAQFVATLQKHIQAILKIIEANRKDDDVKLKAMMDEIKPEADQLRTVLSNPTPPTPPTP